MVCTLKTKGLRTERFENGDGILLAVEIQGSWREMDNKLGLEEQALNGE